MKHRSNSTQPSATLEEQDPDTITPKTTHNGLKHTVGTRFFYPCPQLTLPYKRDQLAEKTIDTHQFLAFSIPLYTRGTDHPEKRRNDPTNDVEENSRHHSEASHTRKRQELLKELLSPHVNASATSPQGMDSPLPDPQEGVSETQLLD